MRKSEKLFCHFGAFVWGGHVTTFYPISCPRGGNSRNASTISNKSYHQVFMQNFSSIGPLSFALGGGSYKIWQSSSTNMRWSVKQLPPVNSGRPSWGRIRWSRSLEGESLFLFFSRSWLKPLGDGGGEYFLWVPSVRFDRRSLVVLDCDWMLCKCFLPTETIFFGGKGKSIQYTFLSCALHRRGSNAI